VVRDVKVSVVLLDCVVLRTASKVYALSTSLVMDSLLVTQHLRCTSLSDGLLFLYRFRVREDNCEGAGIGVVVH
jgi:hypothetical protein